jgi:hypothetical protein
MYDFEGKNWIGENERDLILYKVAWKLWVNENMESKLNIIMNNHYEALNILENVEFRMTYKEDKGDPVLDEEMKIMKFVTTMSWL